MLEKELRVLYLGLQAAGRECHTGCGLRLLGPQSLVVQLYTCHTYSNKVTLSNSATPYGQGESLGAIPIQTTTCTEMLLGKEISRMLSVLPVYFHVCLVMSVFYRGKSGVKYICRHLLRSLKSGPAGTVFSKNL